MRFSDAADAWDSWVGSQTPAEFMQISKDQGHATVEAAVADYVAAVPSIWPESKDQIPENLADLLQKFIEEYQAAE